VAIRSALERIGCRDAFHVRALGVHAKSADDCHCRPANADFHRNEGVKRRLGFATERRCGNADLQRIAALIDDCGRYRTELVEQLEHHDITVAVQPAARR